MRTLSDGETINNREPVKVITKNIISDNIRNNPFFIEQLRSIKHPQEINRKLNT
eukprot:m.25954 g.25954  ORF g.25954 m.25954 type:complete len:54 (-) comp5810_c0_seq2:2488-2649(-)